MLSKALDTLAFAILVLALLGLAAGLVWLIIDNPLFVVFALGPLAVVGATAWAIGRLGAREVPDDA